VIGVALIVLGYLGVFLGKLIRSAISRQREFLADASAVQFTRNPAGIAGALKKIGGLSAGSGIRDAHAAEMSHMFFGDAMAGSFFNFFASHPPLADRIQRLEPEFDGRFPEVRPLVGSEGDRSAATPSPPVAPAVAAAPYAAMALDSRSVELGAAVKQMGAARTEHSSTPAGWLPECLRRWLKPPANPRPPGR